MAFVLKKLSFIMREFAATFHTHALELSLKWVLIIKLGLTREKEGKNVFLHSGNLTNQGIIECQKQEKRKQKEKLFLKMSYKKPFDL